MNGILYYNVADGALDVPGNTKQLTYTQEKNFGLKNATTFSFGQILLSEQLQRRRCIHIRIRKYRFNMECI